MFEENALPPAWLLGYTVCMPHCGHVHALHAELIAARCAWLA